MTDDKSYIKVRDSIELLVSVVEMTYGLPRGPHDKHEDHTTASMFIDAQQEKINFQASFAREQDQLEMIRTLYVCTLWSQGTERSWTLNYYST